MVIRNESIGYTALKSPRSGYITDYISGMAVKEGPEEVDAVQVFSRRLVEDYGYKKEEIQTRPQHRVRKSPSDESKAYPVDIAVFRSSVRNEDELFMIVECKERLRKTGEAQLKLYMDMSSAEIGVWFNGYDHIYLRKIYHKTGSRTYEELPNIPRHGQSVEDIGLFERKDLKKPSNLKAVFRDIRHHLAGMAKGITRDEPLAREIINILFCKILDEQRTAPGDIVAFRAGFGEDAEVVQRRIHSLFKEVKSVTAYADVFAFTDVIELDAESIRYVVGELQNYAITEADRDAIGDAFEVFIGPALRGAEGQFFTPRNVVKMIVDILDPQPGEMIIDPAAGSGGFLINTLDHVWAKQKADGEELRWKPQHLAREQARVATECFRGIDKDDFLAKVCKAYMALVGDGRGGVFCEHSLKNPADWDSPLARDKIKLGTFDVVLTNPPFGAKIPIRGADILSQYDLAHNWVINKVTSKYEKGGLCDRRPPQILFLERCLQLLKPGGRMGIVLPESILGNPSYGYITDYIQKQATVLGVVTLPEALFKTSGKVGTHTKVCVLFLRKGPTEPRPDIFMADIKWCGHDSRGNPTLRIDEQGNEEILDEVPDVVARYRLAASGAENVEDRKGFLLSFDRLIDNILVPKYYDPGIEAELARLEDTHTMVTLRALETDGVVSISTGTEVGKMAYGTGLIPFIRSSDLSNWEIKADFKQGVSEAVYASYVTGGRVRKGADVQAGDILLVRDGTYLIGTSAIVTESDLPMLYQSHVYRIRVLRPDIMDSCLLLACLNMPIVKRQIRAKQFTQDIIDTLGKRLYEIAIPVPKDSGVRRQIAEAAREITETRARLRDWSVTLVLEAEGIEKPGDEEIEALASLGKITNIDAPPLDTASRFARLARQWRSDTAILSNITDKCVHPAYQQIIGLGKAAILFMLDDFQRGDYLDWFWALTAITGENPIKEEFAGNVKAMAEAWMAWGKTKGYLRD